MILVRKVEMGSCLKKPFNREKRMQTIGKASFFVEEMEGAVQTFFETEMDLQAFLFWFRKSESGDGRVMEVDELFKSNDIVVSGLNREVRRSVCEFSVKIFFG